MRARGGGTRPTGGNTAPTLRQPTAPHQVTYLRSLCFTSYQTILNIRKRKVKYYVVQQEICPTTQRIHWQGYMELPHSMTRAQIQTQIFDDPTIHIEQRRGTPEQAKQYCMKLESRAPGTEPTEYGDMGVQGTRTDLDPLYEISTAVAKGTMSIEEAIEQNPQVVVKHHRGLAFVADYASIKKSATFRHIHTRVIWGDPGTGKSAFVYQWCATQKLELYKQTCELGNGSAPWWDGVTDKHKVILIEDFAGARSMTLTLLLQILDGSQCRVQKKGSFAYLMHEHVFILSNMNPSEWYPLESEERSQALTRRITSITHYKASQEVKKEQQPNVNAEVVVTMNDIRRIRKGIVHPPQVTTVGESGPPAIGILQPTRVDALLASRLTHSPEIALEDRILFDNITMQIYRDMQPSNTGAPPPTTTAPDTTNDSDPASDTSNTD